jgi:hypothetical protein
MRIVDNGAGNVVLWRRDVNGNGVRDPEDDFPNDGGGENEVILNGHNQNLDP